MRPTMQLLAIIPAIPGTETMYSRMPVKNMTSDDRMPIANIDAAGASISVKRITVINQLVP